MTLLDSLCTGQIYVPVLALISREQGAWRSFFLLTLYNLAFISPLVAVFVLASKTTDAFQMAQWSSRNVFPAKVALGVVFLVLALAILPWRWIGSAWQGDLQEAPESEIMTIPQYGPDVGEPASRRGDAGMRAPDVDADEAVSNMEFRRVSDDIAAASDADFRDASGNGVARLLLPDGEFAPGVEPSRMLALRNQHLDRLVALDPPPDGLAAALARIVSDTSRPVQWREYCVQVMPECVMKFAPSSREAAILMGELMKCLDDIVTPIAGTALQGLDRLGAYDGRLADIVRESAVGIVSMRHPGMSPATLAAAIRLVGERGFADALPAVELLVRSGPNEFVRKCAEKTVLELRRAGGEVAE